METTCTSYFLPNSILSAYALPTPIHPVLIISEVNVLRKQPSGIGRLLLAHVFGLKIR
jgi:hypothetical protein